MTYRFYVPVGVSEEEARKRLAYYGITPGKYFWFWTRWDGYKMVGWGFFTGCRISDDYKASHLGRGYIYVPEWKVHKEFWCMIVPEWEEENGPAINGTPNGIRKCDTRNSDRCIPKQVN
jgi:hypothetical protein